MESTGTDDAVIRQIDTKLKGLGLFESLRDVIRKYARDSGGAAFGKASGSSSSSSPLSSLSEAEIMASVLRFLNDQTTRNACFPITNHSESATETSDALRRELVVYVDGGKAFVDNLTGQDQRISAIASDFKFPNSTPPTTGAVGEGDGRSTLELCMQLGGRRVRTVRVPATVEPDFGGECYRFPLQDDVSESLESIDSLLDLRQPLSIRMVKRDGSGGSPTLVACQEFEWRKVLVHGRLKVSLPLKGVGELVGPAGMLEIRLQIQPLRLPPIPADIIKAAPAPPSAAAKAQQEQKSGEGGGDEASSLPVKKSNILPVFVPESSVEKQAQHEARIEAGVLRRFHAYAKAWWKEFTEIRPSHRHRLVRLFAQRGDGTKAFACTFVTPIEAPRLLDTPLHAARFVSLMPELNADAQSIGAGNTEVGMWCRPLTTLALGAGREADKAILLASLLLGFGLDAYVCVGNRRRSDKKTGVVVSSKPPEAVFVLTRVSKGGVCIWEAATGRRGFFDEENGWLPGDIGNINGNSRTWKCPLESVHCVFNHNSFLANIQPVDLTDAVNWNFNNLRKWKAFNPQAIEVLPEISRAVALFPYSGNRVAQEAMLESRLKALVAQYRKDECGLTTVWSEDLAYRLCPALSSYESERLTGRTHGNAEFQQAIKRHIPVGHVFKAVPFLFNHRDARKMAVSLFGGVHNKSDKKHSKAKTTPSSSKLSPPAAIDLIRSRGDSMRFAVRVRVFPYPEDVCATWVILAVKYRDVT